MEKREKKEKRERKGKQKQELFVLISVATFGPY
jgi:hypothetical protein